MKVNTPADLTDFTSMSSRTRILECLIEAAQTPFKSLNEQTSFSIKASDDWIILDGLSFSAASLIDELEWKKENLAEPYFSLYAESLRSKL